tara:strand:+ start:199 stop:390 length:192 start_codon:yes stop_codon:yes gene_type:complete
VSVENRKANQAFVDLLKRIAEQKVSNASADCDNLVARTEALDRSNSWYNESASLGRKCGCGFS